MTVINSDTFCSKKKFHQYQQHEQPPLTSNKLSQIKENHEI
jgi:hypothetical protein